MGIVVASVVALLVIAAVAYIAFVVLGARASAAADEGQTPPVEALRYDVPDGQDPVVVLSALRKAGYDPDTDLVEGRAVVVVPCPSGSEQERAKVRNVIADASETTLDGPEFEPGQVTFQDEKSA
jgi:hypothetical protein